MASGHLNNPSVSRDVTNPLAGGYMSRRCGLVVGTGGTTFHGISGGPHDKTRGGTTASRDRARQGEGLGEGERGRQRGQRLKHDRRPEAPRWKYRHSIALGGAREHCLLWRDAVEVILEAI